MILISQYSRAVERLLHDGKEPEAVLAALKRVLAAEQRSRWYRPILVGVAKRLSVSAGVTGYTLTVARATDEALYIEDICTSLAATAGTVIVTKVDPKVIGGYRLTSRQLDIDTTYKKRLLDLYHSLIA